MRTSRHLLRPRACPHHPLPTRMKEWPATELPGFALQLQQRVLPSLLWQAGTGAHRKTAPGLPWSPIRDNTLKPLKNPTLTRDRSSPPASTSFRMLITYGARPSQAVRTGLVSSSSARRYTSCTRAAQSATGPAWHQPHPILQACEPHQLLRQVAHPVGRLQCAHPCV